MTLEEFDDWCEARERFEAVAEREKRGDSDP
jgi:hypothetical protein